MSVQIVLRILIALCSLTTAAHFLRFDSIWDALPVLIPLAALLWPRLIPVQLLVLGAIAGCGLWAYHGITLVQWRMNFGLPWIRLAVILGGVSVAHALTGWLLASAAGRRLFGSVDKTTWARTCACMLVGGALSFATQTASFPLLLGERILPGSSPLWIALCALYANVVTHLVLTEKRARIRSLIWTGFSVFFFGQLALGLAGWSEFLMTGNLHLPVPALIVAGPLFRGEGLLMPILLGVSLLLVGPAWCSYLCYIGAWDDRLSKLASVQSRPLPQWTSTLRIILLASTLVVPIALRLAGVSVFWAATFGGFFGLCGVAMMLTWSRRSGIMTHCTVWCPIGLLNNLAARILPWRIRIESSCTGCGACTPACRYNALTASDLRRQRPGSTCTLCGDCLPRCPHGRLSYAFPGLSPSAARHVFVTLVVSIHAVFVAIARI